MVDDKNDLGTVLRTAPGRITPTERTIMRIISTGLGITAAALVGLSIYGFTSGGGGLVIGSLGIIVALLFGVAAVATGRGADGVRALHQRRAELERRRKTS